MKIYNPTYGALLDVDETEPADPEKIGAWVLSYASPERGLTPDEIRKMLDERRVGQYPDEFFLVGPEPWTLEKALAHQSAVKAFERANKQGPLFPHHDHVSSINRRSRIRLDFVPGPIVDMILDAPDIEAAVERAYHSILEGAGRRFRKMRSFQVKAKEHAEKLVNVVMGSTREAEQADAQIEGASPIRRRILELFTSVEKPLRPIEVASRTGLNPNTVRRELQDLYALRILDKRNHSYVGRS